MTDVFISYSRSIEPQARRVADALRALGYSVSGATTSFRPTASYSEVTEERLRGGQGGAGDLDAPRR